MEYKIEIDDLVLNVEMSKETNLQFLVISDHDTNILMRDYVSCKDCDVYRYLQFKFAMAGGIIFRSARGDSDLTAMIYISRDEVIMRLPEGDYGLEFTSALPVDLKIGNNHITGLQGTIPVKSVSSPFDQRGQTVGTQVNAVSVHGTGNVIGSMNIVNGDFVKGNKYSKR